MGIVNINFLKPPGMDGRDNSPVVERPGEIEEEPDEETIS